MNAPIITKTEIFFVLIPDPQFRSSVIERIPVSISPVWDAELRDWLITPEDLERIEEVKRSRMAELGMFRSL